jgi:hypothetical protein
LKRFLTPLFVLSLGIFVSLFSATRRPALAALSARQTVESVS